MRNFQYNQVNLFDGSLKTVEKIEQMKDQWNANLYDGNHSFVSKYGNQLLELLKPKAGEIILDLGCGTGDLAKKLLDCGVKVIGIDKSENMIGQAKSKYPEIAFEIQDATSLRYEDAFDAVFSNATLHWVQPPKKALECIYASLKVTGRFVAEFGGKGNVQTITNEIIKQINNAGHKFDVKNNPWYYPSIGVYASLMESVGFRVLFAKHYDRPTPLEGEDGLRNWIKMFGNQLFEGISQEQVENIICEVERSLKPKLFDGKKWLADYKRICVVGLKE